MHSAMIISGGVLTLLVFLAAGRLLGSDPGTSMRRAAMAFIPIWLIASGINMWIGVTRAGYTVLQEMPILVPVFGVPAALAGLVIWYANRR